MSKSWLVDGRAIARKVKHATLPFADQIKDCGVKRECPNCFYCIDNSDVSHAWPGLPAGVKFDPSDVQILEHLAAKCGVGESDPHMFIDEFIPTLDMENGICYTHPENLPGAKEDGTSVYFFHKTANAYATGQRKRRKIQNEDSSGKEHVRWHKTGKTKPVLENGTQKGSKKIMVLYRSAVNGSKPEKSNWVMHQYHLGTEEDEKDGDYVVSRIFYQHQKQGEKIDGPVAITESNKVMLHTSPKTPKTNTPNPPRPGNSGYLDDIMDEFQLRSSTYGAAFITEMNQPSDVFFRDNIDYPYLAGESQDVHLDGIEDSLLCDEIFESSALYNNNNNSGLCYNSSSVLPCEVTDASGAANNESCGIPDLDDIDLDTPPDFQLSNLQFGSQDSIFDLLDRL
ncbi:hypothetical protein DCAR_0624484 [Daucus carota subsp. sativus]|uniref:NAC domain-containing protein n=1 Tax=Daucus carota subsp. sativus TaxID=79200 RepID=A0AAF0XDM1_DAUCS|nr:hypothetical protein DCAR_0624484 [Daucus carota subsp. sativus]